MRSAYNGYNVLGEVEFGSEERTHGVSRVKMRHTLLAFTLKPVAGGPRKGKRVIVSRTKTCERYE